MEQGTEVAESRSSMAFFLNFIILLIGQVQSTEVVCTRAFQRCILLPRSPDAKVCFQGDHLAAIFEV
jgi:hypothetical protein